MLFRKITITALFNDFMFNTAFPKGIPEFICVYKCIQTREGRDEVWDREMMFSQLAKWSPCVVIGGYLQCIFHKVNISEARSEPAEEVTQ